MSEYDFDGETASRGGESRDGVAIAALVLGCLNLLSWCLPICGLPLSIAGIVCGVMGMGSDSKKGLAIAGLVLSVLGLIASLVNAVFGAMIAMDPNNNPFAQ